MIYTSGEISVNFYEESVKAMSEAQFLEHEQHHGLSEAQLKEVYRLINPKKPSRKKDNDSSFSTEDVSQ